MIVFFALVLTVLAFAFVAYPLFRQRTSPVVAVDDDRFRELHSKRDTTYAMLKELEFDYQSGILTEEDYRDLETRYKKKAISILKDADSLENGAEAEADDIEVQVQRLRRARGGRADNLDREVEQEVARLRSPAGGAQKSAQARFCSGCGTAFKESDRFCASCGAKLR